MTLYRSLMAFALSLLAGTAQAQPTQPTIEQLLQEPFLDD